MARRTSRIVLGSDLNHHGTLFAGQMAKWVVEACLIEAAKATGHADNLVCVNIDGLTFTHPVNKGDVVDIDTHVQKVGRTSLSVAGRVFTAARGEEAILTTAVTFVTLDGSGKPVAHKISAAAHG
jgi:acyl-CoA hydrolase